ncbi:hypothetical protein LTR66_004091 [Elasticomyces elasticus]|nr:hypothetical protein LTR66_004091 [Elasticomyces elasticus]
MSFKQDFERQLNKELEANSTPPPSIDCEFQPTPPPVQTFAGYPQAPIHTFESYPRAQARRSGMHISTPMFVLFVLVFLFESGVLFVYTVIGLYNATPSIVVPMSPAVQHSACNCPDTDRLLPVNMISGFVFPTAATVTVTATEVRSEAVTIIVSHTAPASSSIRSALATAEPALRPTSEITDTTTASATSPSSSDLPAAIIGSILGDLGKISTSIPAATSTLIFSEIPQRPTVTSVVLVTTQLSQSVPTTHERPTVTLTTVVNAPAVTA